MRLIPGQFRSGYQTQPQGANSQGYMAPEFDTVQWSQSWVVFGCTYTVNWPVSEILGPQWINLSQPMAAANFHIRNLELLNQQQLMPRGCVWVMPDPGRVTVFDRADRVLRWGVAQGDRWDSQGQTNHWDQALRLNLWRRAAESWGSDHLWLTWSRLTHDLVGWELIADPDSDDWHQRLAQTLRAWAK